MFYDPKYFLNITINGQLLLSMLAEDIVTNITDLTVLQINTDGITIKLRKDADVKLYSICKKWEEHTGLILEYASYSKMVIRDVNNYIATTINGEVKPKGCFEIIPMQNGAIAYNKDWSMRVVPKALRAYYFEGIPIGEFIRNHDDIYDFCLSFRARSDWKIVRQTIIKGNKIEYQEQRTIRYYISNDGDTLVKRNKEDGRIIQLNSGFRSTLFNKYEKKEIKDYNINYEFYIAEANKIKYAVYTGQLKMF